MFNGASNSMHASQSNGNLNTLNNLSNLNSPPSNLSTSVPDAAFSPTSTSLQTITASINRISEPNIVRSSSISRLATSRTLIIDSQVTILSIEQDERGQGTYTKCTNIDSSFRNNCNVSSSDHTPQNDDCKNVNTQHTENKCIDNFS